MLLNEEDCIRTQYMPPEPTVKILKRPTNDKNNQQLLAEQKPKAPIKTLQQREQEYAEARLRILGSARSEEEEEYVSSYKTKNVKVYQLIAIHIFIVGLRMQPIKI